MEKFNLKWNYTNKIVNDLLKINRAKEVVDLLELPVSIEEEIKKETIAKRVHYSTKIEGNKLKLNEVKEVIENNKESHERNVLEVRNYFNAFSISCCVCRTIFKYFNLYSSFILFFNM